VNHVAPNSEADPAALLLSFLLMFGNLIGRNAHCMVGETAHFANEYMVSVGQSSVARKGTTLGYVKAHFFRCMHKSRRNDPWFERVIDGGLSTGEGLITQFVDAKAGPDGSEPPPTDKRLMITEGEFARILIVTGRRDNTLSPVMRNAWDHGNLYVKTRKDPLEARGAHFSIIAHITVEEGRRRLTDMEMANGFANRFLWIATRRWSLHPDGGPVPPDQGLINRTISAYEHASKAGLIKRSSTCDGLWNESYSILSRDRYGLSGALCSRAEAHVLRLSMIYALLDKSNIIREKHLRAALEVWRYCEASVTYIFGNALGDFVADAIDRAMHDHGEMTRAEISRLFSHNKSAPEIERALALLEQAGRIRRKSMPKGKGRPIETWEK
jgi:hypothetical protein